MVYRTLLLTLLMVALSSCSSVATLPNDWPQEASKSYDADCVNLSGIYTNKAIGAPTNIVKNAIFLSEFLIPYIPTKDFIEHKWADTIELESIGYDKLRVTMWNNRKVIYETTIFTSPDDSGNHRFACKDGHLKISNTRNTSSEFGISITTKTIIVSSASDGSILIRKNKSEVGVAFFLLPGSYTEVQYYRFLPMSPTK